MKILLLVAATAFISSCGGGGDDNHGCQFFPAASSVTTDTSSAVTCQSCIVVEPRNAIDQSIKSSSLLTISGSGTRKLVSVRGVSPTGISYPAGQKVGAIVLPSQDTRSAYFTISTYLGGTLQESKVVAGADAPAIINDKSQLYSFVSTKAFDAAALTMNNDSENQAAAELQELCVDSN